ncbi:MAG: GTP cyclohydrolase FolE2 [Spirochaetaceae bacterium]|jgi:GTP cyclohydrolase I|nr:GTP cyclohydrolase FolE2 [Spirochaetaceae bacterium]
MIDIQNQKDTREIPLEKAGVRGLAYPVTVLDKRNKVQHTTAVADLFVSLPHNFKGTHMSRFIEIFHKYRSDLSLRKFLGMLSEIREKLDAERAFGTLTFPFFIEKEAPVSGQRGMMSYECTYEGEVRRGIPDESGFFVSVTVPVTTLCPCSRAISDRGAHNQRGRVKARLKYTSFFWIEDIIALVEDCASSGVYSVLKREDEKFVTERAYDRPVFVEDLVREVYLALAGRGFSRFSVEAENFESIHNHNAYAYAEYVAPEEG